MKKQIKKINQLLLIFLFLGMSQQINSATRVADKQPLDAKINEIEFKGATIQDAIRIISELTGINIIATKKAGRETFTLYLRDIAIEQAIDSMARVAGLWYRRNPHTNVYIVMTTDEYFKDIIVFRQEYTKTYSLRYQNVMKIARTIEAMFGADRVQLDLQNDFQDDLRVPGATLAVSNSTTDSSTSSNNTSAQNRINSSPSPAADTMAPMSREQWNQVKSTGVARGEVETQISAKTLAAVRKESRVPLFVSVNREHNLLYVRTADEKALQEIDKIIKQSDKPTPQVLLEMKVLSISLDDSMTSAFDFSVTGGRSETGPPDAQAPNPLNPTNTNAPRSVLGLVNAGLKESSSFVYQFINDHIRARVQLLESEGRVNVLSTPLLLASNNRPAKIFIGREEVITTGFDEPDTGGGNDNNYYTVPIPITKIEEIGNTLTILPSINDDRTVVMRLRQENSTLNKNGGTIPLVVGGSVDYVFIDTITKSEMEGTVMAKDGLSVVIGGMITETENVTESKVPLLGDIPGLGFLFTDTSKSNTKTELILMITPYVLNNPEDAERVSQQRLNKNGIAPLMDKPNTNTVINHWKKHNQQTSKALQIPMDSVEEPTANEEFDELFESE